MIKRIKECKYAYAIDKKSPRPNSTIKKIEGLVSFIMNNKISYIKNNVCPEESAALQLKELVDWIKIGIYNDYVYPYDTYVIRSLHKGWIRIASVTPDYSKIFESSLEQKRNEVEKDSPNIDSKRILNTTLDAIETLVKKTISELSQMNSQRAIQLKTFFSNMLNKKVESFDEAIQRLLFYNGLFWQCKYAHNGLGRLDLILNKYYEKDLRDGKITREEAKEKLYKLIKILGKDTKAKSSALVGDTGQVIIIGGIDAEGNTVENDITHILLEIFTEHPVPDPKLILRIGSNTSNEVWQKGVSSILRGSGSPLIINEDVVMPLMVKFGYKKEDVYNFGTSACWEPLIIGKSFDQNNAIKNITILDSLTATLNKYKNKTFDELVSNLDYEIHLQIKNFNLNVEFDKSPLHSLFFDGCISSGKDFANGGAEYNYHGVLVVGLANLINSLLNIKKYVFEENLCTLKDCINCILNNYNGHEDLCLLFKQNDLKFGLCEDSVISLTNHIMNVISEEVEKRTINGNKVKVGFSSPSYIGLAEQYPASLDGRRFGEPFAVHISPISSDIDIAEILDFASKLRYDGNRINGNVVDFIIPASYAKNPAKLTAILKDSCKKGIFELQLNVVDKKTLIDAKKNPDKYTNLIVRVWGFSAYFNDLPEEYKDNLINRAECYEN